MKMIRLACLVTSLALAALTPEQAVKWRRISDLNFSPDGTRIACVVYEVKGQSGESHVWMADVARGDFRQFTFSAKVDRAPRWSPDGTLLAFLSNRDGATQIYTMPMAGGDAGALTASAAGVTSYRWSPDGKHIAFLAKESKRNDDVHVADQEADLDRIWIIDLATRETRQLTKGSWRIGEFAWLNDGSLAVIATQHPEVDEWTESIYAVAIDSGAFVPLAAPNQPFEGLTVSPGGVQVAFVASRNGGPIPHDLFVKSANVSASLDRNVIETRWQDEHIAVIRVIDGFFYRLYRITQGNAPSKIDVSPYSVRAFDVSRNGTIAFVGVTFNKMPELFLKTPDGAIRQLSHVNASWDNVALPDAEIFRYKSFDGRSIEAALMKSTKGKAKRPLILLVHGGPASAFTSDYFWFNAWAPLLASRGYDVLMVNPRGSAGYGEEFAKANRADWGGGDFKDLMAAVDFVIARGETDPNRLGIAGWSYGGEMSAWAITQTNRFKAAVVGGVVFDQAAEFEMEDEPAGDAWYFGTPWDNPDVFAHNSPSTYVRHARTPTLILHGENDAVNPPGQATALYRALKHFHVETQLVTYPREGHLPREESHQIDMMRRMLDWFDRHLQ